MALDSGDLQYLDRKFGDVHSRITDLDVKFTAAFTAPCRDLLRHEERYHGDTAQRKHETRIMNAIERRQSGMRSVLKVSGIVLALTTATITAAAGVLKIMELMLARP